MEKNIDQIRSTLDEVCDELEAVINKTRPEWQWGEIEEDRRQGLANYISVLLSFTKESFELLAVLNTLNQFLENYVEMVKSIDPQVILDALEEQRQKLLGEV